MKHEDIYLDIFERVKKMLIAKYEREMYPDASDFELACVDALIQVSHNFDVNVQHLGKRKFPDIKLEYCPDGEKIGVEVKLHTEGETWTTLGNSTYASTQEPDLETVFLLFGNFEKAPPMFEIKPYANCIKDIKSTHNPRYIIDMEGTTDFCAEQLGVTFDQLRNMDESDRIVYVNTYIAKKKYKELSDIPSKERLIAQGFVLFPEFFSQNQQIRYRRMSVWLFAKNILCRNVRDFISASGVAAIDMIGPEELPRIYTSLLKCASIFRSEIEHIPGAVLKSTWSECGNTAHIPTSAEGRIALWLDIASHQYGGKQKKIGDTPYKFRETVKKIIDA